MFFSRSRTDLFREHPHLREDLEGLGRSLGVDRDTQLKLLGRAAENVDDSTTSEAVGKNRKRKGRTTKNSNKTAEEVDNAEEIVAGVESHVVEAEDKEDKENVEVEDSEEAPGQTEDS